MIRYLCNVAVALPIVFHFSCTPKQQKIDRFALVNRHNVTVNRFDSLASITIGNGNFAFTTDLTGLQTFYKEYENGVSLGTMSNWGWHSIPNTEDYDISESYLYHEVNGRKVPYQHQLTTSPRTIAAHRYFRENPQSIAFGHYSFGDHQIKR